MKLGDTLDASTDVITGLHRSHASGGSAENQIAGREANRLRGIADHFRDRPDQIAQIAALFDLAVHREPDSACDGVPDVRHGTKGTARR